MKKVRISVKKQTESATSICSNAAAVILNRSVRRHYKTRYQCYTLFTNNNRQQRIMQITSLQDQQATSFSLQQHTENDIAVKLHWKREGAF